MLYEVITVVPIVANRGEGLDELMERVSEAAAGKVPFGSDGRLVDFCAGPVHKALHAITHIVEDAARKAGIAPRFAATKLIEGDPRITSYNVCYTKLLRLLAHARFLRETYGDDIGIVFAGPCVANRITSYNVCYTKLLRV